ncbi:MAG: hypothetical protein KAG34_01695 [Cocleimonas sp.]|nr:hypothetical protein [Cocleimonas sp.]
MFSKSSPRPLIVELMDISKQNEAILKFFISGVGNKVFSIGTSSEVEAYIVDYDFPGAKAHWDEEQVADKPRIILSTDNPQADNSVWVGKPLSSKKLIEAASAIKDILTKSPSVTSSTSASDAENLRNEVKPKKPDGKAVTLATETLVPKKNTTTEKVTTATLVSSGQSVDDNIDTVTSKSKDFIGRSIKSESSLSHIAVGKLKSEQVPKKEPINKPKTKEQKAEEVARREMRWKELCGENNDTSTHQADELRYVPENYFIGKLTGAVRLAKQSQQIVEIQANPYSIYILPNEHLIFTKLGVDSERFIKFSHDKIQQGEMNIHILSSIETGKLELQMNQQPEHIHSLESYLWTSSLLVSKGRIPATMDIDKKTALRYWPSFARIEAFPYSMRIAALWHHSPDTLIEMATKLAIPQRYVFAFYNGADALGLVEHDPKKVKKQIKASPKKKGGGLISRLFKRLLGGDPS